MNVNEIEYNDFEAFMQDISPVDISKAKYKNWKNDGDRHHQLELFLVEISIVTATESVR